MSAPAHVWLLVPLLLAAASPCRAATLPFQGHLEAFFTSFGIGVSVDGAGLATVNGDGTGGPLTALALPAGAFHATAIDFPGVGAIAQIRVTAANGAGSFDLSPGGGGGVMPLPGFVRLCLVFACDAPNSIPLLLPLDPIGAGGTAMVTGAVSITVEGMPWQKSVITISTPGNISYVAGFAHGPLSNTGTTAQPGGVLELVTPAAVRTSIDDLEVLRGFALLHVEFVPEPASGALVAAGLALLAAGRRLQARRGPGRSDG